ncbi:hypothetical protein, partial [Helicobacter cetorum]|uniref:PBECR3 domain-containing polyvalent protein n=1 Tax=Helicobacter cetorum TaxID=138563 RepID=UPI000CF09E29
MIDEIIGSLKATKEESEQAFKQESAQASKQAIETNPTKAHNETQNTEPSNLYQENPNNNNLNTQARDYSGVKLNNDEIKEVIKNSHSKGKDMPILGEQNFTPEVVEFLEKNHYKIAIEKLDNNLARELGLKYQDEAKFLIDSDAIKHILKNHGTNSNNAIHSKQPPITYDDVANYQNIVKNADESLIIPFNNGERILSYKQVNGYFVVVEQVSKKQNGLNLVTMFKENGKYKDGASYKETTLKNPQPLGYKPSAQSQESSLSNIANDNSTTNLSLLDQANKEKQAKLNEQALKEQEQELKAKAKSLELEKQRQEIREAKESVLGKAENEREINKGEKIAFKRLENAPKSSVSLNDDEIYPLDFAIVKSKDLKPNFKPSQTQTRTHYNEQAIKDISQNFKPEKVFNRGGFDDLPIILEDGQIIAGNHRTQGMINFNTESRKAYEQAIKEHYNLELQPDELLVRMPSKDLSDKEIINLAAHSNKDRANSYGDKVLSALAKYDTKLKDLPKRLESESVEELSNLVARNLEKDSKLADIESANLALLTQVAKNDANHSLSEVLEKAHKQLNFEDFKALKDMFVENAGSFYNLLNNTELKNLNISPYLVGAIDSTIKSVDSGIRAKNLTKLYESLEHMISTTDKNGINEMIKHMPNLYDEMISDILGVSLARFVRLENPSSQLYEFLKKAPEELNKVFGKSLFGDGKALSEMNVFNLAELALASGERTNLSDKIINLLPKLEEKYNAYLSYLRKRESQKLESHKRPFKVIEPKDRENFLEHLNKNLKEHAISVPKDIDIEGFLKSFNGAINKENFLKHLESKTDSKQR